MTVDFMRTTIPGYDGPQDSVPDFEGHGLLMCKVCHSRPVKEYGGRGPKPTKCDSCSSTKSTTKVRGKSAELAGRATAVLMQLNGFVALGLAVMQLHLTAGKFREEVTKETFEDTIYNALILDPELCEYICRGGVKSGKVALFVGYGMVLATVFPTAVLELREKAEDRKERKAQREAEERMQMNAEPVWTT